MLRGGTPEPSNTGVAGLTACHASYEAGGEYFRCVRLNITCRPKNPEGKWKDGMTEIDSIEIELLTGDEPGAGTDALLYLGLGGREFLLDNYDEDDFRRGDRSLFRLGRGSSVTHPSTNDPRTPPLTLDDLDRHPVYLRLNAQVENDSWLLVNAWVVVRAEGRDIRYGRPMLDGTGESRSIWLGLRDGCVLHFGRREQ